MAAEVAWAEPDAFDAVTVHDTDWPASASSGVNATVVARSTPPTRQTRSVSSTSGGTPPSASPVGGIGDGGVRLVGPMTWKRPSRASSKNATTRRSYSFGRVLRPSVWPPSEISQRVFGPCAAS